MHAIRQRPGVRLRHRDVRHDRCDLRDWFARRVVRRRSVEQCHERIFRRPHRWILTEPELGLSQRLVHARVTQRSGAIAGDWYFWGHIRTIDELKQIIDGLTVEAINDYMKRHPLEDFTIVTFGAKPLEVNGGVS